MFAPWWIAYYKDGRAYCYGEIPYSKLDRDQIKRFVVLSPSGRKIMEIEPRPGQTLIFRRRTTMDFSGKVRRMVYVCGYVERGVATLYHVDVNTGKMVRPPEVGPYTAVDIVYTPEELEHIRRNLGGG